MDSKKRAFAKIPKEIYAAMVQLFRKNAISKNDLVKCTHTITHETQEAADALYIDQLEAFKDDPELFLEAIHSILEDASEAEKQKQFAECIIEADNVLKGDPNQVAVVVQTIDTYLNGNSWVNLSVSPSNFGFYYALSQTPRELLGTLVTHIHEASMIVPASALKNISLAVGAGVVIGRFGVEFFKNIYRWWIGEISGARCAKNCIDSAGEMLGNVLGGVGGAMTGATIGAAFGPLGAVVGGVAGGIVGSVMGANMFRKAFEETTQYIFNLPKSEALEKSYNFFGLDMRCSDDDIKSQYRQLARQYHPDKGGDRNKWNEMEVYLGIILAQRR